MLYWMVSMLLQTTCESSTAFKADSMNGFSTLTAESNKDPKDKNDKPKYKNESCIRRCTHIIARCTKDFVCPKALHCMHKCSGKPYDSCGKVCMRDHRSPIMHEYLKCVKIQCHGDPKASLFGSKAKPAPPPPDKSTPKEKQEKLKEAAFPPYKKKDMATPQERRYKQYIKAQTGTAHDEETKRPADEAARSERRGSTRAERKVCPPKRQATVPSISMHAKKLRIPGATSAAAVDVQVWRAVFKELNLNIGRKVSFPPVQFPAGRIQDLQTELVSNGFFHLTSGSLDWAVDISSLRGAVQLLHRLGWDPIMLLLFDEAWLLFHQLSGVVQPVVEGGHTFEFSVSYNKRSVAPWGKGRDDNGGVNVKSSFKKNGMPRYSTAAIELTDAAPSQCKMWCLPAAKDENYNGDIKSDQLSSSDEATSMESEVGDVHVRSHRLLHWANVSEHDPDRIAVSVAMSDNEFPAPRLMRGEEALPLPTWQERLALCAYHIVKRHHVSSAEPMRDIVVAILTIHGSLLAPAAHQDPHYQSNFEVLFLS